MIIYVSVNSRSWPPICIIFWTWAELRRDPVPMALNEQRSNPRQGASHNAKTIKYTLPDSILSGSFDSWKLLQESLSDQVII